MEDLKTILYLTELSNQEELSILNNELVKYMDKPTSSYSESDEYQLFTNGKTSAFYFNFKVINFEKFKSINSISLSNARLVAKEKIIPFFDRSNVLFGNSKQKINLKENNNDLYYRTSYGGIKISINEAKLINLLLKNSKIYCSSKNHIIKVENEVGKAYILSPKNKI